MGSRRPVIPARRALRINLARNRRLGRCRHGKASLLLCYRDRITPAKAEGYPMRLDSSAGQNDDEFDDTLYTVCPVKRQLSSKAAGTRTATADSFRFR